MKKTIILLGFLALAPFAKGQLLLEALEGGIPFIPSEKCLERVYDKHYGDGEHNFIYCAVQGPNGKKWLNLNLGAEYAKESSPHFNPEAVPTDYNDWKAYGSLFQWGRGADGHELGIYTNEVSEQYWKYTFKNEIIDNQLEEGAYLPNSVKNGVSWLKNMTADKAYINWTTDNDSNPCPAGYRITNSSDFLSFIIINEYDNELITGKKDTSKIFKNPNYPNLYVVTSPVIYIDLLDNTSRTNTFHTKFFFDWFSTGTSSLWTVDDNKTLYVLDNSKWTTYTPHNINIPHYNNAKLFDNGVYINGQDYKAGVQFNTGGIELWNFITHAALRCIEK